MSEVRPLCAASEKHHRSYPNAARKDYANRMPCPVCGKVVTLKRFGLDREPDTLPQHRIPAAVAAQQGDKT